MQIGPVNPISELILDFSDIFLQVFVNHHTLAFFPSFEDESDEPWLSKV